VEFKFIIVAKGLDSHVALRLGQGYVHGLVKNLKALYFFDGGLRGLGFVKNDKGLALGL
jgi:hypothetical protein